VPVLVGRIPVFPLLPDGRIPVFPLLPV